MIQQRNLHVIAITTATVLVICALTSVEGQFMAHRIERDHERTAQKLFKHIMELELPIGTRRLPAQARGINRRDMGVTEGTRSGSISDNKVADSGENECNPNSIDFNYLGYDCICTRLSGGKWLCTKQQHPNNADRMGSNDPDVFMMLNNFEKLVAQLKSRPKREERRF